MCCRKTKHDKTTTTAARRRIRDTGERGGHKIICELPTGLCARDTKDASAQKCEPNSTFNATSMTHIHKLLAFERTRIPTSTNKHLSILRICRLFSMHSIHTKRSLTLIYGYFICSISSVCECFSFFFSLFCLPVPIVRVCVCGAFLPHDVDVVGGPYQTLPSPLSTGSTISHSTAINLAPPKRNYCGNVSII